MEIKQQIINSAIELFSTQGFEGVSLRTIASHAGVHFASIRYYFGEKEELYRACISSSGDDRLSSAKKYLSDGPTSLEDMRLRLSFAIKDVLRIHSENPYLTKLLLMEIESEKGRTDTVLKKTMIAMAETYAEFFKRGQRKGYINKEIDSFFLAQTLLGTLHHFMRTEKIRSRLLSQKSISTDEGQNFLVNNILKLYIP